MASKKKPQRKAVRAKPKSRTKKETRSASLGNGSDGQLVLAFNATFTPVAAIYNPGLPYEKWAPDGIRFRQVKEWLQFAIGDWLNAGEQIYGEMYTQGAADTGLPEETLMILKYVSSRVAPDTRIKDLTWSHHREVAKFPPEEQTRWLEKALKKGWSVRELRDALKKESGKEKGEENGDGEGRGHEPPTGEACGCCGASPAPMRICSKCAVVPAKALETIGIRGAIELLNRKPSKPQIEMLKWAHKYIKQPPEQSPEEEAEWEARYEALGKVVDKAA